MKRLIIFFLKWSCILILSSLLAFSIPRAMPGKPVDMMLTQYSLPKTPENIRIMEEKFGLDKPYSQQYRIWVKDFIKGDWGKSYLTRTDLKPEILARLPLSLAIGLGGMILASIFAFFLGYLSAIKERGLWNLVSQFITLINQTVPVFILILILIYFLGVKYQLVSFFSGQSSLAMILALVLVALSITGPMSRTVRSHFIETKEKSYMSFYISRGYEPNRALLKYGSRPALYGLLSVMVSRFASVIGGSAVVEFAFAIPGISVLLIESISNRDYLIIQTYIMMIVLWMFLVHLVFGLAFKGLLNLKEE